jgi:hypothetical protein
MRAMTIKSMLLLTGGALSAAAMAATLAGSADLEPATVSSLTGTLRIQQGIPCDNDVDQTSPVTGGAMQLTPAGGIDVSGGGKRFTLNSVHVSFGAFSISRSCLGFGDTRSYSEVGVQLERAVSFVATPLGSDIFAFTIPKDNFLIFESSIVNNTPETGYKQPSEDVTGTLNLASGAITVTAVVGNSIHFQEGCVPYVGCVIDDTKSGTLTATIAGTIAFPDADADGVPDRTDNCRFVANPDQTPVPTPVVSAPPNLTLASCTDHAIGQATAVDVCDATPVGITSNAPPMFNVGSNLVTWTGVDGRSRVGTATQNVSVVDTTAPVITFIPPDLALNNCVAANLGVPAATDDCAGTPTFTNNAPAIFPVGQTHVTWTATDASGNHAQATQTVVVTDTVPPSVSCVATRPTGNAFIVSSSDACGAAAITLGGYSLVPGETVAIEETGSSGVRLVNAISSDGIRHFHVGKGEGVIIAVDGSGNASTAVCK